MLFHSLYEVSVGLGGRFFLNDIGETFSLKLLAVFITPICFVSGNYCLCKFAFRWAEDMLVAERFTDIWPDIKSIINFWERQPKCKRPGSKSYIMLLSKQSMIN